MGVKTDEQLFYIYAWRFLVVSGLRRGELCGLRNEDIKGRVITIRRSINRLGEETEGKKENAQRQFVLSKHAIAILADQRAMLTRAGIISPWVFPDEEGGRLDSNHLYKKWLTYRKQHDLTQTLHEMRHSFISYVKADMPEELLKGVVGHSDDMDTFGTYGHEVKGDMQRAADVVDVVFDRMVPRRLGGANWGVLRSDMYLH